MQRPSGAFLVLAAVACASCGSNKTSPGGGSTGGTTGAISGSASPSGSGAASGTASGLAASGAGASGNPSGGSGGAAPSGNAGDGGNLSGVPWAGIIDPARAIDWSQAGVVGDIPMRTTVCATLMPGATAAQINMAIAVCPAGQVVSLAAGTYMISDDGIVMKSGITLRGAGSDKTLLNRIS
jgi:hypothetical protein